MSYETLIDEPVKIWVLFDFSASPQQISPIAMNWQKRLIKFQKVIFTSIKKRGEVKILNLICASEGANFELEYNNNTHLWKLKKIMPKE